MIVEITGGSLSVGKLTWGGYVKLKNTIRRALQGPVAEVLRAVVATGDLSTNSLSAVLGNMADNVGEIDALVTDAVPELIRATVKDCPDLEQMSAVDVLRLREAVLQANPLNELLDAEKNWYSGVIGNLAAMMPSAPSNPATSGT
jgi:NAD(P)-dependent dehydrogenase (short-subunit alcohol dehydrogenase family)